jgi:hypothetical protein
MMTLAFWTCALLTAINAVVSLGFTLGGLRKVAGTAAVGSRYACARSLALAVIAVSAVFIASMFTGSMFTGSMFTGSMFTGSIYSGAIAFVAAAAAMTVVQAADAVIGVGIKDPMKTWGRASLAVMNAPAVRVCHLPANVNYYP